MAEPRSAFNFNRDFSQPMNSAFSSPRDHMPVPYAEHLRLIEEARQEAYANGVADGRVQESDAENRAMTAAMDAFVMRLQIAAGEMARVEELARKEAMQFALLFARKLSGRLIEKTPIQSIEATARAIFNDVRGTPHIAIRVAPSLVDACKNRITLLMGEMGIEAKLFVFPDPGVAIGDCRIEWADGGIVRDSEKLAYMLEKAMMIVLASNESDAANPEKRGA